MIKLTIIASLIVEVHFRDRNGVLQWEDVRNFLFFDAAFDFKCSDRLLAGDECLGADFELHGASFSQERSDKERIADNFTVGSDGMAVVSLAMVDEATRQQHASKFRT